MWPKNWDCLKSVWSVVVVVVLLLVVADYCVIEKVFCCCALLKLVRVWKWFGQTMWPYCYEIVLFIKQNFYLVCLLLFLSFIFVHMCSVFGPWLMCSAILRICTVSVFAPWHFVLLFHLVEASPCAFGDYSQLKWLAVVNLEGTWCYFGVLACCWKLALTPVFLFSSLLFCVVVALVSFQVA